MDWFIRCCYNFEALTVGFTKKLNLGELNERTYETNTGVDNRKFGCGV